MTLEQEDNREQYVIDHCDTVDGEQLFRGMIDECQDPVCIGSIEFTPSRVLEELDLIAFRCGVSDYMDSDEQFVEIDGEYYLQIDVDSAEADWDDEQEVRDEQTI